jgi:hypothetical protein
MISTFTIGTSRFTRSPWMRARLGCLVGPKSHNDHRLSQTVGTSEWICDRVKFQSHRLEVRSQNCPPKVLLQQQVLPAVRLAPLFCLPNLSAYSLLVRALFGGWQVVAIETLHNGARFTITGTTRH